MRSQLARRVIDPPYLRCANFLRPARGFQQSAVVRQKLRRSPTARNKERQVRQEQWEQRVGHPSRKILWPTGLLERASQAGVLPFSAITATAILDDVASMRKDRFLARDDALKILKHFKVEPVHLSMLAHVLLQTETPALYGTAKILFATAAVFQDEMATLALMQAAVRSQREGELLRADLQNARTNLVKMADRGNRSAQILRARVLIAEKGNSRKALSLLESAVQTRDDEVGTSEPDPTRSKESKSAEGPDRSLAEAWRQIGQIKAQQGEGEQAKQAFEKAATVYDDPQAYYLLAARYAKSGSERYIEYMLKAAMAGVGNAAYRVGVWNLQEIQRSSDKSKSGWSLSRFAPVVTPPQWMVLIRQWFSVAAESIECDFRTQAKLHVARLLLQDDDTERAQAYLQDIADDQAISPGVRKKLGPLLDPHGLSQMTGLQLELRLGHP